MQNDMMYFTGHFKISHQKNNVIIVFILLENGNTKTDGYIM